MRSHATGEEVSYSDPWEADDGGDWEVREGRPADLGNGECIHETEKAVLVKLSDCKLWVPKSQLHDDSEVFGKGMKGRVVVKFWWAEKQELA